MPYRRSARYQERVKRRQRAMQEGRTRARMELPIAPRWEAPDLRRRLIVEDYDSGAVRRTVIDMHATTRIDCYQVAIDGKVQPGRIGWSRILNLLREAMPRKCSLRWVQE